MASSRGIEAYDDRAAARQADAMRSAAPDPGFVGVDYLLTMAADEQGYGRAALVNRGLAGGLGLSLRFRLDSLPYLSVWKMLGAGDYVVGIEPVNTKIANRAELRAAGRLPMLEPGEARDMNLTVSVLAGADEIDAFAREASRAGG